MRRTPGRRAVASSGTVTGTVRRDPNGFDYWRLGELFPAAHGTGDTGTFDYWRLGEVFPAAVSGKRS